MVISRLLVTKTPKVFTRGAVPSPAFRLPLGRIWGTKEGPNATPPPFSGRKSRDGPRAPLFGPGGGIWPGRIACLGTPPPGVRKRWVGHTCCVCGLFAIRFGRDGLVGNPGRAIEVRLDIVQED
jgi:hypothetical protein